MGVDMTIMFDFDEVFVDINSGALDYINSKLGSNYVLDDIKSWDFFNDPRIRPPFVEFLGINDVYQTWAIPNREMIDVCKQLINMGEDVYIVTASLENSHASKLQFIKEQMSFFDLNKVFVINSTSPYKFKSDVLEKIPLNYRTPIVLVDDGIHNILDMMADIRHKDKLDRTMKQFYTNKLLQKYNNPYHDFIYGIVPELTYNKELDDGKRIFKIRDTKHIWKVLEHIKSSHDYRISSKESEICNYLNNLITPYLNKEGQSIFEVQNNFGYLMSSCFSKDNKNGDFLTSVGKLIISLKHTDLNIKNSKLESIFESTEALFNSVMYSDIEQLILEHIQPQHETNIISAQYGLMNSSGKSILSTLIDINKNNLDIVNRTLEAIQSNNNRKQLYTAINTILFNEYTGINNIECLSDTDYLKANLLLILNKNYELQDNNVVSKHAVIEDAVKYLNTILVANQNSVSFDII